MKSNLGVLLKCQLLSTSSRNILKHTDDKKKRGKIIGGYVGAAVLYLMLLGFCVAISIGFGLVGLTEAIPQMCAVLVTIMEFFFTVLKTNGYLFGFKEYDMIVSLPFRTSEIAGTRFLYMYIKNFPWVASISIAMMIGYVFFAPATVLTCVIWVVLTFLLPLIPMVVAAALGTVIAAAGSGFKHKQLVQTILTFIFLILCFSSRFIIDKIVKDKKANEIVTKISSYSDAFAKYYPPVNWFTEAVVGGSIVMAVIFTAVSVAVLVVFCVIVGKYYRRINSGLKSSVSHRAFKMRDQKMRSVRDAIVFKEFKRFTGSTLYITNAGFGQLLCIIATIAVLFVDVRGYLAAASLEKNMIGAIPVIYYFFLGMCATTACSLSLEGKNYWIIQSLPIDMKTVFKGKMLFNLYLTVPFMIAGCVVLGIKMDSGFAPTLVAMIFGVVLCLFSTAWGMRCGAKHAKFDWENEVEVIKQGTAVTVYLLPNMFGTMLLGTGLVILSVIFNVFLIFIPATVIMALLAWLAYRSAMKMAN